MLTTAEVATLLGVKPATVYAYVSRGLLTSVRNGEGKGSLFNPADVEAFAIARRADPSAGAPAIHTGITLIREGRLFYRGRDAIDLAMEESFESVITLLWSGRLEQVDMIAPSETVRLAKAVTAPLPASARLTDRLRVMVAAAAAADLARFDTTPTAVVGTARVLLTTMIASLPMRAMADIRIASRHAPAERGLAAVLWPRLTAVDPTETGVALLNAVLILLADHDMAASTLAARVAASTRANPYAVVGAGLAVLDGPLHGAASSLAYELIADAIADGDPVRTVSERLRVRGSVPGFRHGLYPNGDPRAMVLLDEIRSAPRSPELDVVDALIGTMAARSEAAPNVDFALAAFTLLNGMPPDAGEAIFAIARTVGWIAHALEEYADRPSRFRPNGLYAGPRPATEI